MKFEMIPCSEDEMEYIEEQMEKAFNTNAQPD